MIERTFDEITGADIAALVERRAVENRTLEFKRELPGTSDADGKEFLADVTSFANTNGGDLIFGLEEADGGASAIHPIPNANAEREMLRLENLLRDGVEPRLQRVRLRWIGTHPDRGVLLLRIPGSLAGPHRIRFRNSGRFYGRNSRGKYEMDTFDLRQAFTASEHFPARLRTLHANAVASSSGGSFPFRLVDGPVAIATIIPLSYLRETRSVDVSFENALLPPNAGGGFNFLNTLEGVVAHTPILDGRQSPYDMVLGYALTHWRGRTDTGWAIGAEREMRGQTARLVWPERFENGLIDMGRSTAIKLKALGVEGPWAVLVTIDGVEGFELVLGDYETSRAAWRRHAELPELIIEQIDENTLRPIFDAFWLLFGERRQSIVAPVHG
jgi:hypothetical protein